MELFVESVTASPDGLNEVPFSTYEQIFDNDRLPRSMIIVGGGPIGMEMSQAYQRLGEIYLETHQAAKMRQTLERYLRFMPDNFRARAALRALPSGSLP